MILRRFRHTIAISLALLCCAGLCGCSLLPKEEELPSAPLVNAYAGVKFTLIYVQRGDLVLTERYNVTYSAVRQERLSFPVSGLVFKGIYARAGDTVQKGDILAELDQSNLAASFTQQDNAVDNLKLQIQQLESERALAVEAYNIRFEHMNEYEQKQADPVETVTRSIDTQLTRLRDQLSVASLSREVVQNEQNKRVLRAGIDGTVTYIRYTDPDSLSIANEHLITIADSSSSLFVIDTKDVDRFPLGMKTTVVLNKTEYPVTVVSPNVLGDDIIVKEDQVYLMLDTPSFDLEGGDRGVVTLELDRCEDCLYIQAKAVKTMNGESFVYVQDENGVRSTKPVTVGFLAGGNIEILSGLAEGDAVILR